MKSDITENSRQTSTLELSLTKIVGDVERVKTEAQLFKYNVADLESAVNR